MVSSLLSSLVRAINSCFDWFVNFFASLPDLYNFLICVIIMVMIYRFLLSPLFKGGVGSSDTAKKSKKKD